MRRAPSCPKQRHSRSTTAPTPPSFSFSASASSFATSFLMTLGAPSTSCARQMRARARSTRRPGREERVERERAARSRLFALFQAQPCDGAHFLDHLRKATRGRADEAMGLTRRRDREVPISRRALALILDFSSKETSLMSNAVFSSTVDAASASAGVAAAAAGAACPTPPIICGIIIPPPPPDSSASLRPSLR